MDALLITPIPAFEDNYLWLLERSSHSVIVDPGDAAAVERVLTQRRLRLDAILVTHHHFDHVGGIAALLRAHDVPVYGPATEAPRIPGLTQALREGDRVALPTLGVELGVMEVPGHTLGHIAYVADAFVLCGDTLFSAGCGRLFEGTAAQLHGSLARLAALPAATRVYCTHEYTRSNLAFARAVEPGRAAVEAELRRIEALRAAGHPSLPSTIGHERDINPFLRCGDPAVVAAASRRAGRPVGPGLETFTALRQWKDGFRAP
ncbi:MAG TPA: hydroxyacylglutathione hydrolase [Verrucomicrobiae bacterium]|nr:hydroxyacylglutathione hydrolase [Verrucomicrobiae bacterium]